MLTELQHFISMLGHSGIGYGTRHDHNPEGTAVLVEHENDEPRNSEWWFDADGSLVTAHVYTPDNG